jgi:hypothetical protein
MRWCPLAVAASALALYASGCATATHSTAAGAAEDPSAARAEIAQLEARIGFLRGQLRLPSTPPVGVSQGTSGAERCREVGAAAEEICRAAVRICALAELIAEDGARASCTQAREDCRRAREIAEPCK